MSTGLENELLGDTTEALPSEEEVVTYNGNREYDAGPNTGQYGYVEVEIDGEMRQCTNAYMSNSYGGQYCVGDTYTDPNGGSQVISSIDPTGLDLSPAQWDAEETYADAGEKMGMSLEEWTSFSAELQELNETVNGLEGGVLGPTDREVDRLTGRIQNENPDWSPEQVQAEADRLLVDKYSTGAAYAEAAAAETALFAKYGIRKDNPAAYGSGVWIDEDGKYHKFESNSGNFYQTSQDDGFLDYAVPVGIALGATLITGGGIGSMLGSGMNGVLSGALQGAAGSAAGQGIMGNGIDPAKLLQAAMLGGLGSIVSDLQNMDGSIMDNAIMGGADSAVEKVSEMLNIGYDQALEIVAGVAEGTITGGDLESIVGGVVSNLGTSTIQDYLTEAFGDTVNVDDWFKDGESHIPMEAFEPVIKGSIEAAISGGMDAEDAIKMAWGYFDNGGDIDFMLPGFTEMVDGWDIPGLDFEKGGWGMQYDEESGDWVINHDINLPDVDLPDVDLPDVDLPDVGIDVDPFGCGEGETWAETLGQCVPDVVECIEGFDWDGQTCVPISDGPDINIDIDPVGCGEGETWSEVLGQCIPDVVECVEGFEWDGQTCVEIPDIDGPDIDGPNIDIDPVGCGEGETWDEVLGQCIPDVVECIEGFEWDGQTCVEIEGPDIDGPDIDGPDIDIPNPCDEGQILDEAGLCKWPDIDVNIPESQDNSRANQWSELFQYTEITTPGLSKYAPALAQVKGMFNGIS